MSRRLCGQCELHRLFRRLCVIVLLFSAFVSAPSVAQASPVVLRVGAWVGEQLIGYGTGKAIDKVMGLDCEDELRQVEASLSVQLKKERGDKEKIRAELAAVQSQLQIINSLLRSKPTPVDVDQFRRQLAQDLDKVLLVQEKQEQRLTKLEQEVGELTTRLRRLEFSPRSTERLIPSSDQAASEIPGTHKTRSPRDFNVPVMAVARWTSTGIHLAKGERVSIQANGRAATVPETYSGPRGQQYRCDATCTFPGGYYGQLVGKVSGGGKPFAVGERVIIIAPSEGELFLAVNDCCDWSDNDGFFNAFVSVGSPE